MIVDVERLPEAAAAAAEREAGYLVRVMPDLPMGFAEANRQAIALANDTGRRVALYRVHSIADPVPTPPAPLLPEVAQARAFIEKGST
jgi:hypothetical protein